MTRRTIIIGDIHGMRAELEVLLDTVGFAPGEDRLVVTGDVVHKGPDSAGAVRVLREAGAELVLGNHDEKQNRFRKALAAVGGELSKIKMKDTEEMAGIEADLSPEDAAYLESAKLFVPVPGGVAVHAGLLDDIDRIPSEEELDALSKGERKKLERVLRVRFVRGKPETRMTVEIVMDTIPAMDTGDGLTASDVAGLMADAMSAVVTRKKVAERGSFLSLGKETSDDPYWADVYDGRHGHVYFGHQPFLDDEAPKLFPHATGLDLGAVFGGHLAAVVLEEGRPDRAYTVKASKKYATSLWED